MPKAIVLEHYVTAYQILINDNWYSVDPCDCYEERTFPIHSKIMNPEVLLLKRESFNSLSTEAKEIILTIINCPEEMLHIFKTKEKNVLSKKVARQYFHKKWRSKFIVDLTFKEIIKWVEQL